MLKSGIINPHLLAGLARLRHTDTIVIADAGLPIPRGIPAVDLAIIYGSPRFEDILRHIVPTIVAEGAILAEEARGGVVEDWVEQLVDAPLGFVPHRDLKNLVQEASLVVRTGEDTPFANVILRAGVPF